MDMTISIALATYNGAAHLKDQLDSYIGQEKLPDEVVICDDGSKDGTFLILEEFKRLAPFQVRIIKNENNLGFTKNFEKAISNCSGDLIFLSDQDDVWFPGKIRNVEKVFMENPDKWLLVHDGELVDENMVSYGATKHGQVVAGYGSDDHLCTGALTAFRKELIQYAFPIPNGIVGHDGWLHNIAKNLDKRMVLKKNLQHIRRHSQNTSVWVASSVNPINRFTVARNQFASTPSNSYEDRLINNSCLTERLQYARSIERDEITAKAIRDNLNRLSEEYSAIISRSRLIQLGFVDRKATALKMMIAGEYAYFNGVKSFLRDFFR